MNEPGSIRVPPEPPGISSQERAFQLPPDAVQLGSSPSCHLLSPAPKARAPSSYLLASISKLLACSCPGGKLILFLFEQNIERGQRAIAASDVLLELELVCISEFVACVHLLLEHAQIVPDHDDFMKERFQRHFLRLD